MGMINGSGFTYRRAVKCYQKAITIKADLIAAGMELANALTALGDQVGVVIIRWGHQCDCRMLL